jgi:hypothetical protein
VKPIPPDQFRELLKTILPTAEESGWSDIPWLLDLHAARVKAAAEGKPLLIWHMAGEPLGLC